MTELSETNDDLHNVLAGVDTAVVIVGMDLRIRRYTSAAEKLLNLIPGDIGRSIGYLDAFLGTVALESKVSTVIHSLRRWRRRSSPRTSAGTRSG
jgi:two-component system, chemotaxis family, CheB/CheR fusion protein